MIRFRRDPPDASHGVTIQKAAEVDRLIEEFVWAHPVGASDAPGGSAMGATA